MTLKSESYKSRQVLRVQGNVRPRKAHECEFIEVSKIPCGISKCSGRSIGLSKEAEAAILSDPRAERERLDKLVREAMDDPSEIAEWKERKAQLAERLGKEITVKQREHVCRYCGWLAQYQEKKCGACGKLMEIVNQTRRIGGSGWRQIRYGE